MKWLLVFMVLVGFVLIPLGDALAGSPPNINPNINQDIYAPAKDNALDQALLKVVRWVGGIGGTAFVLAVLVISLLIIFGSISAQKMRTVWLALISCIAGAFVFYSAYLFAPAIQNLAKQTAIPSLPFLF